MAVRARSSTSPAAAAAPNGQPHWATRRALWIGGGALAITVALALLTLELPLTVPRLLAVLAYVALLGVGMRFLDGLETGVWTGHPHLIAMVALLTLDLNAALLTLIGGALVTAAIGATQPTPAQRTEIVSRALAQIAVTGSAVVAASLPWAAVAARPVEQTPLLARLSALVLALALGFLVATLADSMVRGGLRLLPERLRWLRHSRRVLLEGLRTLVIASFALAAPFIPVALQILLLALVILQAVRYKNVTTMQQELHLRVQQLSQINRAAEALSSTLALDVLIETICRQVYELTHVKQVGLTLVDAEAGATARYHFCLETGLTEADTDAPDQQIAAAIVRDNMPYTRAHEDAQTATHDRGALSVSLGLPLSGGPGAVGALLLFAEAGAPSVNGPTLDALHMLARQAGLALNNALVYRQSQALIQNLSLVNVSIHETMQVAEPAQGLEQATAMARQVANADAALLLLPHPTGDAARVAHAIGLSDGQRDAYDDLLRENPPAMPDAPLEVSPDDSESQPALWRLAEAGGFQTLRVLPLASGRTTHGWLVLANTTAKTLRPSDRELLLALTQHIAAQFDNAELFDALESYAFEMAQLAHLSRTSASNLDVERVVEAVGEILNQMMSVDRTTIVLNDGDNGPPTIAGTVVGMTPVAVTPADQQRLRFPELAAQLGQPEPAFHAYHADEPLSDALRQTLAAYEAETLIVVPLAANDTVIGALLLISHDRRVLNEREWQLAEMAANQIAAHLQNARLYGMTQRALNQRLEQLALIESVAGQISSTLDFNQIVKHMLEAAVRSTEAHYAALILLNEPDNPRMVVIDYANSRFSRYFMDFDLDNTIVGHVIRTASARLTADTSASPHYVAPRTGATYRASLAVPLLQENTVLGVLNVESENADAFTDAHVGFLNNLAGHAVISIGNARMLEERQYQVKVLTNLQALALRLSSAVDTRSVADAILETTAALFESDEATIFRYEPATERLATLARLGAATNAARLRPADIAREAALTGEIQVLQAELESGAPGSTLSVPLQGSGRTRDVLSVTFETQRHMPRRDFDTLGLLASQAAGHLENATLHEEIRAGNERMAAILDSTRDGVILLDRRGALIEANPAARAFFGDGLAAYLDDVLTSPIWVHHDGQPPDKRLEPSRDLYDDEGLTRRQLERPDPDGGTRYLEEIGAPVLDENGAAAGWLLVLRDVTEARLLADYRDEITSMVIHDLRGPLASIISGLYIAMDELSQHDPIEVVNQTVELASDSANRLMILVESLLDVSRMEARQMDLRIDTIAVERLVDRAAVTLASTLRQSAVHLERAIPPDLPPLQGDYDLLARVLINLLDNAARYTPPNGAILVGAELCDGGAALLLRVADSGRGIPADERERVFEKFKQARGAASARGKRGTGLGLTFCRLAVEAHGGRIWIEDQGPLPGASFVFTIPMRAAAAD